MPQEDSNIGFKVSKDIGFEISPQLQYVNSQVAAQHETETAPMIQSIMSAASPNATGEDRLAAAQQLKNASGSEEFRGGDFIQSLISGKPRDMYIAATGGADIRTRAWDQNGKEYVKVFNQRKSDVNPYGEVRRYETLDGKPVDEASLKGKLITSQVEIPLTQQPFFQAQGLTAKDVAAAQSANWNNIQKTASNAILAAPELKSLTQDNRVVLKQLQPFSVDPATRTLLAGAAEMRTGNTQELQNATEKMKEFASGKATKDDFSKNEKTLAGLNTGLLYQEGKGFVDSNGKTLTTNDIERISSSRRDSMGSSSAVTARKDDLMQKAQALALKGQLKNFDLIQRYINNQYKTAKLVGDIEKHGGIGIAKPNLDFQTGDSFSLAFTKNELDDAYADLADMYSKTVSKAQQELGSNIPAIGRVESAIATNPFVKQRKQQAFADIKTFEESNAPVQQAISQQTVSPALVTQPGQPVPAPAVAATNKPSGSRPPVAAAPAAAKRSLSSILGGK